MRIYGGLAAVDVYLKPEIFEKVDKCRGNKSLSSYLAGIITEKMDEEVC